MSAQFHFDASRCRLTAQAFAAGMLSFLGHNPTFQVHDLAGELQLDPGPPSAARLNLVIQADSISLTDNVEPTDRHEMESRMRDEVLAVGRYPDIRFNSADIAPQPLARDKFRLNIRGGLTLRGVGVPLALSADMHLDGDEVRLIGETPLALSSFHIAPISALGGTLRLKDQIRIAFDLCGIGVRDAMPTVGGTA